MRTAPTAAHLPARARAHLASGRSALVYHPYETATWRVDGADGGTRFLKAGWAGSHPSISAERDRNRWLAGRGVPVPRIFEVGAEGDVEWMLTAALSGRPATAPEHVADPVGLVTALAEGLHAFHRTDPAGCPFDYRPPAALAHVRARVAAGLVDARAFHPVHATLGVTEALARLEALAPAEARDVVICHGDYCPPNVFLADGRVVGYLDVGEAGLGERWRDLAVATWSITWTLGPGHEDRFLEAYGAAWDRRRSAFYRLLFDLES
jgi:aminoglycoside phosphotransferase